MPTLPRLDYTQPQNNLNVLMWQDETVFITGFPGFIASRLVRLLAVKGATLLLLVQDAFESQARHEIESLVAETGIEKNKLTILTGDITVEDLGLTDEPLARARNETTTVFHLAALYDLAVRRELALRVNLGGTRNINSFVRTLPKLRRYNYISTCYVAGKRKGLIQESELYHEAGFRNFYEESKYLAESEVESLKSELPITIHRPSVVCGDSKTGETAKYDGVYYLIRYLLRMPRVVSLLNIGNRKVSLNLVPVDFVVEAISTLAADPAAQGKTLQIADPDPLTTYDLCNVITETIYERAAAIRVPATLVEFTLSLPLSPSITGLPHHGVPYFFLRQTYDATKSRALLEPQGVICPRFSDYVRTLVGYCSQHSQPEG